MSAYNEHSVFLSQPDGPNAVDTFAETSMSSEQHATDASEDDGHGVVRLTPLTPTFTFPVSPSLYHHYLHTRRAPLGPGPTLHLEDHDTLVPAGDDEDTGEREVDDASDTDEWGETVDVEVTGTRSNGSGRSGGGEGGSGGSFTTSTSFDCGERGDETEVGVVTTTSAAVAELAPRDSPSSSDRDNNTVQVNARTQSTASTSPGSSSTAPSFIPMMNSHHHQSHDPSRHSGNGSGNTTVTSFHSLRIRTEPETPPPPPPQGAGVGTRQNLSVGGPVRATRALAPASPLSFLSRVSNTSGSNSSGGGSGGGGGAGCIGNGTGINSPFTRMRSTPRAPRQISRDSTADDFRPSGSWMQSSAAAAAAAASAVVSPLSRPGAFSALNLGGAIVQQQQQQQQQQQHYATSSHPPSSSSHASASNAYTPCKRQMLSPSARGSASRSTSTGFIHDMAALVGLLYHDPI